MTDYIDPNQFIISRKRKQYKFALFHNSPLCVEFEDWTQDFHPQVLEVGAGTGLFSAALAERYPELHFLAMDVKGDRLQTGARQAESQGSQNIRFLRARGDQLSQVVAAHSLDQLWITFPDPHPKKRSAGRRLTHPTFLKIYQQLLAPGSALYFKTDARDLFTWTLEQLVATGWNITQLSFDLHESELPDDYKIMTTYEKKFTSQGLPTHFVRATPPATNTKGNN